ncbi:MAG: hypothetical protein DMG61_20465 [Acidobacteria bacterium]|nr:MAG: hypothetical protein DMG61_20465 [Acidobacteriota bacterium]
MMDKGESRQIRVQIRHVLLDVWDPIGVKDVPNAQDEYDSYIGRVYELLMGNSPDRELAEYLFAVVRDDMGLDGAKISDMNATVKALREIQIIPVDSN